MLAIPFAGLSILIACGLIGIRTAIDDATFGLEFEHDTVLIDLQRFLRTAAPQAVEFIILRTGRYRRLKRWQSAGRVADFQFEGGGHGPGAYQDPLAVVQACLGAVDISTEHFITRALVDQDYIIGVLLRTIEAGLLRNRKLAC